MSEDKKIDYEALCNQWEKELMENPVVQEYCKPYRKEFLEHFCKAYAKKKSYGLKYGEMYQRHNEMKENEWIDAGYEHLSIIQQKKLFDAQCLWRANQLDLKEIEIGFDFRVWEEDVLNCPFIEPITEQEVDWYCQYLSQNNVELKRGWLEDWQDYEGIKEAYETDNGNRNLPDWYEFHNGKTGNGTLLILPDVRGEREEFYRELYREDYRKENATSAYVRDPELNKPFMNFLDSNLQIEVAKQIEDKHTLRLMQEYVRGTEHHYTYENERADEDFRYLSEILEPVPIESHYDYRQALSKAVESYKCRKIAEHLHYAFQKYEGIRKIGFALGTEKEKEQFKSYTQMGKNWKESVLKGRELNGEPRDFKF